ncbi:MAG: 16S rRNA processing protein RimM [Desulfobacula sp.]|nr:16S rRNA processing protein RimM [Desulfobacula sp.]MBT3485223.1 16S rRNA processing protein RimM [Desulfobacula sp.]MBT3804771.1 16S rRNA processing protein RimM [Desulfobacula sp.]MBT4025248.1 16S rRNA processing protein RimM [Desulfobacula sp.]MBT4200120.1 16S rRNA processing protein RimM [Desulfobacula sp.]
MNKTTSFTIGKVTGVHGLNGNLKVWSFAESVNTFCPGIIVLLKSEEEDGERFTIIKALSYKKGIILSLKGIDTRNLAEDLIGKEIFINRNQLPEPEEDTWYWQDLLGLGVIDHKKGFIGRITDIFPTGANDVLVVTDKDQETLVPMHKHFVESVDLEKNILQTKLPEDY